MPQYIFIDEETGEVQEIFFKFSDAPSIGSYIEYEGKKLRREATVPYASSDTVALDPFSSKDFNRLTNKGGTLGQMMDLSAEMSEKRAQKHGYDPIKLGKERKAVQEGLPVVRSENDRIKTANKNLEKWGVELKAAPKRKLIEREKRVKKGS